jgi:hypothetical protein
MATCDSCGNEYDKAFTVTTYDGSAYVFDSFECAIHIVAPRCEQCSAQIIGHGVEADGHMFCCAHCAQRVGITALADRA